MKLNPEAEAFCREKLGGLIDHCEGAYGAILSTIDGNELTAATQRELPTSRIAAMSSSLVALGETMAREARQQACKFVIVENSDGYAVTMRITPRLVLTSFAGKQANLGMLLSSSRATADVIASSVKTS